MRIFRSILLLLLIASTVFADGNSWNQVRYNGGTLPTKVDSKEWDNQLTVTSTGITLELKDGQKLQIPTKAVTGLSYGQEAHRRLGTMFVVFGLFQKTRLHYIGIEYLQDGKKGGLLLQGHKDNYRGILAALESVTKAPISVSEKDRDFVPASARGAIIITESDQPSTQPEKPAPGNATKASLSVSSEPSEADVYVDDNYAGTTPCKFGLDIGRHRIKVIAKDYRVWIRDVTARQGSELSVSAKLEK